MNHFKVIIITYNHVSVTLHDGTTTQVVEASICQNSPIQNYTPGQSLFQPTYNMIKDKWFLQEG